MQVAELILKYVATLIYPALIIVAFIVFRKQIAALLSGDFRAKYKDLELTIERSRKTVENIRDVQEVAISKMKETIEKLESDPTKRTEVIDLKMLIESMEISLDYWESIVMRLLRKKGGRYPERGLIDYYFEVESDPWRREHEEDPLRNAIRSLLTKSVIARDNGYLVLHSLLPEKPK